MDRRKAGPTGRHDHESDWGRIRVRLNPNNGAIEVVYDQHDGPPKQPKWEPARSRAVTAGVQRQGLARIVRVGRHRAVCYKIAGQNVRIATDANYGTEWHTRNHLVNAHDLG